MAKVFSVKFIVMVSLQLHMMNYKGVHCLQRFEKQPSYSEVNPGEDIKLDCIIISKKGSCSWQKDNKPVGIYLKKYEWAAKNEEEGDCSLWIRAATLEFDDGQWECQVTASDFTTQDALTSTPVRLVVRVAPERPRIEFRGSQLQPGSNLTAGAGDRAAIKCLSRHGNPPPRLEWYLDKEQVTSASRSESVPETDNRRTWLTTSLLDLPLDKHHHDNTLYCVAVHESYPTKSQYVKARLDVTYPPDVKLIGVPETDVEEGDTVVLKCETDANPVASVVWRRAGSLDVASLEESLQFRPITRKDSGTYTCQARNVLGSSEPMTVQLDVKYAPTISSVGRDKMTTATLFSPVTLACEADANPTPNYQWLQRLPASASASASDSVLVRSTDQMLILRNVTYEHQGEYVCRVTNTIAGTHRTAQSEAVSIQVVGAPQILREGGEEVIAAKGSDATLRMVVCADPRPETVSWEWESNQVKAGDSTGRYQAHELKKDGREDCFESRLQVGEVEPADARNYDLLVKSDRGFDRHSLRLVVHEPVSMMTLIFSATGCLLISFLCIFCAIHWSRSDKRRFLGEFPT
ncbi:irregular chiasm C-roughest protein-like [Nilaparvata lugens]|uniref:irregular chiasm C-roughest protein-like n=1 Tax=Nilaparvata lugens TaxID=108931 RepID=UPI00193CE251|nr:irregular chiasm C-roughest protein-like [Nilaparvata lugens]